MKILWTEHATTCLIEIEAYIALDDPVAAQRWVEQLVQRTKILVEQPHMGRKLPEMPRGPLRELVEGNYRIVYRVVGEFVEILTVFERHRLLREDDIHATDKEVGLLLNFGPKPEVKRKAFNQKP